MSGRTCLYDKRWTIVTSEMIVKGWPKRPMRISKLQQLKLLEEPVKQEGAAASQARIDALEDGGVMALKVVVMDDDRCKHIYFFDLSAAGGYLFYETNERYWLAHYSASSEVLAEILQADDWVKGEHKGALQDLQDFVKKPVGGSVRELPAGISASVAAVFAGIDEVSKREARAAHDKRVQIASNRFVAALKPPLVEFLEAVPCDTEGADDFEAGRG